MFTDTTGPSKVTAAHLQRRALLYVRQSSLKQVLHNTESAIRQYDLRGKAIALAAGPPTRSPSSTSTRASPAPRPPTAKASGNWSPTSPSAGPESSSVSNAPAWPATAPTGTNCSNSAR